MKKTSAFLALLVAVSASIDLAVAQDDTAQPEEQVQPAIPDSQASVMFKWAVVKRLENGDSEVVPESRRMTLAAGDSLKIYLNSRVKEYIYILMQDSRGSMACLYPPLDKPDTVTAAGENLYVPAGEQWLRLDQEAGAETLYVIAATNALTTLESTLKDLSGKEGKDLERAVRLVVTEIKTLRKRYSRIASTAEKPVSVAGTFKGGDAFKDGDDSFGFVDERATLVSAAGFFSKTVEIEHR